MSTTPSNSEIVKLPWESFQRVERAEQVAAMPSDAPAPESEPLAIEEEEQLPKTPSRGAWWTIPLLCAGICLVACCVLIPQADTNRRLAYEAEKLKRDLEHIEKQTAVNEQFLKGLANDPNLAERLAQRQMKVVREGTNVLKLKGQGVRELMSPYVLVTVPPPPPLPEYKPLGGFFADLCRQPKSQLYMTGAGLLMIAAGLVCGAAPKDD